MGVALRAGRVGAVCEWGGMEEGERAEERRGKGKYWPLSVTLLRHGSKILFPALLLGFWGGGRGNRVTVNLTVQSNNKQSDW